MENSTQPDTRYPIGPFQKKDEYSKDEINAMISIIEKAPARYKELVDGLSPEDLGKTYRPGSWSVRQLAHHVADIQLLHFFRMKKALTEPDYRETTLIDMDAWAAAADGHDAPIGDSLLMFDGITRRYVFLMRSLNDASLKTQYYHPVRKYHINQAQAIAMSAWHVRHHFAHIQIALGHNL